jgi:hypothetical protein
LRQGVSQRGAIGKVLRYLVHQYLHVGL